MTLNGYFQTIRCFYTNICGAAMDYIVHVCAVWNMWLQHCFIMVLDKLRITKNGSITNRQVPLLITLRSPLHFQYHIDFVDMENKPLGSMEGMRGQTTFTHMLPVERDTDVMARFRIGEIEGPDSDPVTVDVEDPGMLIIHAQPYRVDVMYQA